MQLDLPLGLAVGVGEGTHTPPDTTNHKHHAGGVHGNGGNGVEYKALGTLETMHEVSGHTHTHTHPINTS